MHSPSSVPGGLSNSRDQRVECPQTPAGDNIINALPLVGLYKIKCEKETEDGGVSIFDFIKRLVNKLRRGERLAEAPDSERLTFINDAENLQRQAVEEYRVWYRGDSNELLNYYTNQELYGNAREPIYNRNRRQYFWGIVSDEAGIKRVHSGIPNAIVTTLVNAIGTPTITSSDPDIARALNEIMDDNDFTALLNQQQMPLTMVDGWGGYKLNIDSGQVRIQYYTAKDFEPIYRAGQFIGGIFRDYYRVEDKDYALIETRRTDGKDSYIEPRLYRYRRGGGGDIEIEALHGKDIPEQLRWLNADGDLVLPGYPEPLAVPCKFLFDPLHPDYGRSIYEGKIDLFDDLDQILSQDSQTVRVSTPVEYIPVDLMQRNADGIPQMPKVYNRQFLMKESMPDGNGNIAGDIQTTQPRLDFSQYSADARSKLDFILTGLLSPATMGIDLAKRDNADAQREKEKVTIMTRNNIIDRETRIIRSLMEKAVLLYAYQRTGEIPTGVKPEVSVRFNEFANPSFEQELSVLAPAWSQGAISTEKYIDLLWGDRLTPEEKREEAEKLEANRQSLNGGSVDEILNGLLTDTGEGESFA